VPSNRGNRLVSLYTNPLALDALDHLGHGTHVAGIIAGNGYDSGGQYIGIAPNAMVVSVKIADNLGRASEGDVISGLEWVYSANRHGLHIRVVNLSLQSTVAQSYNQSSLDAMVEKLWFSGVVVVASAGNGNGPVMFAPGNDPYVITVGSIEDHYNTTLTQTEVAPWSLTGTTQDGFAKPEVVADGSHVVSLLAPGGVLTSQHPANIVGASYFKMGGTSMAAPQVAGMAALMLQANPDLSPNRVKRMLRRAARPFSTVNFTPWLGTAGGFLDASSIGQVVDADDNAGVATSADFNPLDNTILAGGGWWQDAIWSSASWNGIAWNPAALAGTAWNGTAWSSRLGVPVLTSPSWDPSSWAGTAWNGTAWNGTALSGTAWNAIEWSGTAWNGTAWNGTAWNGTAWNGTAWNSTQFVGTAWNGTAWNGTAWNGTAWNGTAWNDAFFG
jgi:serine protease AprX